MAGLSAVDVATNDDPGRRRPYQGHDALATFATSYQAATTEEAFFRGYALPVLQQRTGHFWVANGIQATGFALLHDTSVAGKLVIGASALLDGHLTRRNHGSIRQVVFIHTWWDLIAFTGYFLTVREKDSPVALRLRPIVLRF